jgi:hypothetical protein
MNKTVSALLFAIFTLTACLPTKDSSITPQPTYPDPSYPNSPTSGDYIPSPADSALTRGEVFLDGTEIITMESYPLQFLLHFKGNLPTPCHSLRIAVSQPDSENKMNVDVYSVFDPNTICVQALAPFDVNFSIGSYAAGHYFLYVNGTFIAEFVA